MLREIFAPQWRQRAARVLGVSMNMVERIEAGTRGLTRRNCQVIMTYAKQRRWAFKQEIARALARTEREWREYERQLAAGETAFNARMIEADRTLKKRR